MASAREAVGVFVPYVRHTFLAVPFEEEELLAPHPAPRARSVPVECTCDRYAREVHALMFKPRAWAPPVADKGPRHVALPFVSPSAAASATASTAPPSPSTASVVSEELQLRSQAVEELSTSAESYRRTSEWVSEDESSGPGAGTMALRRFVGFGRLESSTSVAKQDEEEPLEAVLARVPRDEDDRPTSLGSERHWLGDCRPCAYAATTQRPRSAVCVNGVRCPFCHFPHAAKRRTRLCRRKRIEMRAVVQAAVAGAGKEGVAPPPRYVPIAIPRSSPAGPPESLAAVG